MAQQVVSLEELIKQLSPDMRQETTAFVQSLLEKRQRNFRGKLTRKWRGVLSEMRDEHTSTELKHKITQEWRDEDIA